MKRKIAALLFLSLSACQNNQLSTTESSALSAGALGAGLGAIIGHQTGNTGAGIAIGAASGLLAGGAYGNQQEQQEKRTAATNQRINQQESQLAENQRLIRELRSRGADVRATDRGVVVNLPDVLFDFDRSALTNAASRTTSQIAEVLSTTKGRDIYVEGHTDAIGSIAYNQRLSENRAWSVADSLVKNGIDKGRILVKGFGESDPIASNSNERGRSRNRRVEVIIANR